MAKGWFYSPKAVVLFLQKKSQNPPRVIVKVGLSPIWGCFYAQDQLANEMDNDH